MVVLAGVVSKVIAISVVCAAIGRVIVTLAGVAAVVVVGTNARSFRNHLCQEGFPHYRRQ